MLHGVHHVALNVSDVAASDPFFVGILGLRPLDRPDFGFPGAWFEMGEHQLHLSPAEGAARNTTQHFALDVRDFDGLVGRLRKNGARVAEVPRVDGAGRQAFVTDPAGNLIELNQPDGS